MTRRIVPFLLAVVFFFSAKMQGQTVISGVTSASAATSAVITWTTSTPSTSQVLYGTNYGSLPNGTPVNRTLVTSHSVTVSGLSTSQSYFFAVSSIDNAGYSSTSNTYGLALCGHPSIAVAGTVNNYYQYGTFTITYTPLSDAGATPTVCGTPITTMLNGDLAGGANFSIAIPVWGLWTTTVADAGDVAPISIMSVLTGTGNDISTQLQAAAATSGLVSALANTVSGACYPAFLCAGGATPYPPAGIPNSTGTSWGTSYTTSGTGTTVALTNGPTFTTVIANSYIGQFSSVYGTLALGSGSGGTIEKTISDATPIIVASQNGATTGTGDYYAVKDSSGAPHTVVDHSLGLHGVSATLGSSGQTSVDSSGSLGIGYTGTLPLPWPITVGTTGQFHSDASGNVRATTFNGIALATGGPTTSYLGQDGTYHALPATSNGFPIILGTTSIAANSTNTALSGLSALQLAGPAATADQNFSSGALTLTASFFDLGPTPDSWTIQNVIVPGSTPSSTLTLAHVDGGTTGSTTVAIPYSTSVTTLNATTNVITPQVITESLTVNNVGGTGSVNLVADNTASGSVLQTLQAGNGVIPLQSGVLTTNYGICANGANPAQLDDCGQDAYGGTTPSYTTGTGAGINPTVNILGNRHGGQINILTGSSGTNQPVASQLVINLTFSSPYAHYAFCTISGAANIVSDPAGPLVSMQSGYPDRFYLYAGATALNPSANHTWYYTCEGY